MKKRSIVILIIILVIVAGLAGIAVKGWAALSREHAEARNLPIAGLDFSTLKDGIYTGAYEGGMYRWRANKVKVTVDAGKVTSIEQVDSADPGKENTDSRKLYDRIIEAQSLQVDVISGATLTSRAYLKGVEMALIAAKTD
ncbi:MAG: FMN-binding protein [Spirochaetales bacterium]|nr:FMN-binding protein [Spirochaetales bacterium]